MFFPPRCNLKDSYPIHPWRTETGVESLVSAPKKHLHRMSMSIFHEWMCTRTLVFVIDYHSSQHIYINRLMAVFVLEDWKTILLATRQEWLAHKRTGPILRRQGLLCVRWCPRSRLNMEGFWLKSYVPPQIRRSTKLSLGDNHIMRSPFFPSPVSSSVLLFYTARVASLTLSPPQLLTPKPPAPLSSSNSSANASQADGPLASSSILSHLIIECDANLYGQGLNYDSCHDAYDQIPHFVSEMTWGPRTQGRWSVNLPWRAYSCEFDTRANLIHLASNRKRSNKQCWSARPPSRRIMRHQRELALRRRRLGQGVMVPHRSGGVWGPRAVRATGDVGRKSQESRYEDPLRQIPSQQAKPSTDRPGALFRQPRRAEIQPHRLRALLHAPRALFGPPRRRPSADDQSLRRAPEPHVRERRRARLRSHRGARRRGRPAAVVAPAHLGGGSGFLRHGGQHAGAAGQGELVRGVGRGRGGGGHVCEEGAGGHQHGTRWVFLVASCGAVWFDCERDGLWSLV